MTLVLTDHGTSDPVPFARAEASVLIQHALMPVECFCALRGPERCGVHVLHPHPPAEWPAVAMRHALARFADDETVIAQAVSDYAQYHPTLDTERTPNP